MGNRRRPFLTLVLALTALCIVLPMLILAVWSFADRWAWPNLVPVGLSLRALGEVFAPYSNAPRVLLSSVVLSLCVALAATAVGTMSARALVFFDFKGRNLILFSSMLPILVPATAFAMGINVVLIRLGLANTLAGVFLVHTIYALPYTVNIMLDMTRAVGDGLEMQARVLGAKPWRAFLFVTLPQLLPGMLSAVGMGYIISFSQYFLTLMVGGGKVITLSVLMVPIIQGGDRSLASVYALLFVLSSLLVFALFEAGVKRLVFGSSSAKQRGV
ncbi:MAG: ABC transporter permease subunit [Bacillota bacterium]